MFTYNFKRSDGTDLASVFPLESNGVGNISVRQAQDIVFDSTVFSPPCNGFVVEHDVRDRFVQGFMFEVTGGTPHDGAHVVNLPGRLDGESVAVVKGGRTFIPVPALIKPPVKPTVTSNVEPVASLSYNLSGTATPLMLVGQGAPLFNEMETWGSAMQHNMLHILENFASRTPPVAPMEGQLWYEKNTKALRVFNGSDWQDVSVQEFTEQFTQSVADKLYLSIGGGELSGSLVLSSNPAAPMEAATKGYVDAFVNGVVWSSPILDPNLFDDSLSTPPHVDEDNLAIPFHRTYIVNGVGEGDWEGLDGHAVHHNGVEWISVLGRPVRIGDRFGVYIEPDDILMLSAPTRGGLRGNAGSLATVVATSPLTYAFETPIEPDAVTVKGTPGGSPVHVGHAYTFRGTFGSKEYGTGYRWIEIAGPTLLSAGGGLRYTGNVLNVGVGTGVTVNGDLVSLDLPFADNRFGRRVNAAPSSSSAPGRQGDWFADDAFLYTYGATGWRRVAATTF